MSNKDHAVIVSGEIDPEGNKGIRLIINPICELIIPIEDAEHLSKRLNEAVAEVARSDEIDLVLMDIKMPYLNGIEATRKIRETNQKIPILAQTAFLMEDEQNQILKAGCNEVLAKPIRRNNFEQLLAKYIPELKLT